MTTRWAHNTQLLDVNGGLFDEIRGGIMVRSDNTVAGTSGGGKVVDFSINADSTVWVCK